MLTLWLGAVARITGHGTVGAGLRIGPSFVCLVVVGCLDPLFLTFLSPSESHLLFLFLQILLATSNTTSSMLGERVRPGPRASHVRL